MSHRGENGRMMGLKDSVKLVGVGVGGGVGSGSRGGRDAPGLRFFVLVGCWEEAWEGSNRLSAYCILVLRYMKETG